MFERLFHIFGKGSSKSTLVLEVIQYYLDNERPLEVVTLSSEMVVNIGRSRKNQIFLNLPFISKEHGVFFKEGNYWYYEDKSRLGSFLERRSKLFPVHKKRFNLKQGDIVKIVEQEQGYFIVIKELKK